MINQLLNTMFWHKKAQEINQGSISEVQESTQNVIEGEISGKCDSQSGNGDMVLEAAKNVFPFNIKRLKKNRIFIWYVVSKNKQKLYAFSCTNNLENKSVFQ